jgi:hypothetical protein
MSIAAQLFRLEQKVDGQQIQLDAMTRDNAVLMRSNAVLMRRHAALVRGQIGTAVRIAVSVISGVETDAPHATDLKQIQGLARDAANLARVRNVVRDAGVGEIERDLFALIKDVVGAPDRIESAHPPVTDDDIDAALDMMPAGRSRDQVASAATVLRQLWALAADVGVDMSKYK